MLPYRPATVLLLIAASIPAAESVPAAGPAAPPAAAPATAPAAAPAIEAPKELPKALDLPLAIDLALKRNETPLIAQARLERAEAAVSRARSAVLPQLILGGSLSTSTTNDIPHGGRASETAQWSASAELSLINPSAWSNLAAAGYSREAQRHDSQELKRALAFSVADIYLTVLASEQQVVAAQRALTVSQASVADAKARLDAGMSTKTDVTRAELGEAQAQLSLTQARRGVTVSRLALGDLIASNLDGPLAQPTLVAVENRDGAVLFKLAVWLRGDLKALEFREIAAEESVRAGYGRYLPTISARATASRSDSNAPGQEQFNNETDVTLSLVATWSIYDGGDREGAIASARADRREAGLNRTAQVRGLRRDILTALADLETAEASLAQAEASDRLARARAEEIRARFKQGLATALEDADAISGQFAAESALVSSRFDLERTRLALRKLCGMWPLTERAPEAKP